MDQRSKNKIKLFRVLKVVFYCLGLPLFVLATLLLSAELFSGEAAFWGTADSAMFASMKILFSAPGLYGVWVAFGVWLVIAVVHIVVVKTVNNIRARTMIVAAVTLVVMLVPVVVMDLVMPAKLDAIAAEAPDGVVVATYKDQLGYYNTKTSNAGTANGRRESYTDTYIKSVENFLEFYNVGMTGEAKDGVANNGANAPIRYEQLYGYEGSEKGLINVAPDGSGKLVLDGKVYDGYYCAAYTNKVPVAQGSSEVKEVTRYFWYKQSRMASMQDGYYGYASYNSNGLFSDGYVFGIDVALRILEEYYYAQTMIEKLGGDDSKHEAIMQNAIDARNDYYNEDPSSEEAWVWNLAFGLSSDPNDGYEADYTITQGDLADILNALGAGVGTNYYIGKLLSFVNGVYPLKFENIINDASGTLSIAIRFDDAKGLQIVLYGTLISENTSFNGVEGSYNSETGEYTIVIGENLIRDLSKVLDMIGEKFLGQDIAGLLNQYLGEGGIVGTILGILGVNIPITIEPGMSTEDILNGLIFDLLGGLYWYADPEIKPVYDFYVEAASEADKELAMYYAMLDRATYEGGLHGYMIGSALIPNSGLIAGDNIGDGTYPSSLGLADYTAVKQLQTDLSYKSVYYPMFAVRDMLVSFLPFVVLFMILSGIAAERQLMFETGQEVAKPKKNRKGNDSDDAESDDAQADENDNAASDDAETPPSDTPEEGTETLVSDENVKEVL